MSKRALTMTVTVLVLATMLSGVPGLAQTVQRERRRRRKRRRCRPSGGKGDRAGA